MKKALLLLLTLGLWHLASGCAPEVVQADASGDVVDDAGCRFPSIICDGICVNPNTDDENCGSCGHSCGEGQICSNGYCVDDCPTGLVMCSGVCVDTNSNSNHCGRCGYACFPGQICQSGICICPDGTRQCGNTCVDTDKDENNCGSCDHACEENETCVDGYCISDCPEGSTICDGACVDTDTSQEHCGRCNNPCDRTQLCQGGECICAEGRTLCQEGCVDTDTNRDHCGQCDRACPVGALCRDGECLCPPGQGLCDEQCVDTDSNPHHCGECNHDCGAESCIDGECGSCPPPRTLCGDVCTDLDNDPDHCGRCDITCRTDQDCIEGTCQCPTGFRECTGVCVNTQTSSSHCGSCDHACGTDEVCLSGICECREGLTDCDGSCVDTESDENHCGSCTEQCGDREECSGGDCLCISGYTRCGTECVNTQVNPGHCGECFHDCAGGVCSSGECQAGCEEPLIECDGSCIDPDTDAEHCGDCDTTCAAFEYCDSGDCTCLNDFYEYGESNELGGSLDLDTILGYSTPHYTNLRLCGEEIDWYSLYVPSDNATLAVLLDGDCQAEILPRVAIMDSTGTFELAADEGTTEECPFVWADGLEEGMVYIQVENIAGAGAYELIYELYDTAEREPNETTDTATGPFGGGFGLWMFIEGALTGLDDWDTYLLWIPRNTHLELWADNGYGGCETATWIWVTDAWGEELGDAMAEAGQCPNLELDVPRGYYYVTVIGELITTEGDYFLQVSFGHDYESEPNAELAQAEGPYSDSFGVEGVIFPPYDVDRYAIELTSPATIRAEVHGNQYGCMLDSQLELWSSSGTLLGEDDDYDYGTDLENLRGFGWCSRIDPGSDGPDQSWAANLPVGTYYLLVKGYDNEVGAYNLNVDIQD